MAIEKIKKIIFTLICIVLVTSVGVVAYAAWDDVTGKKTGDLGVNTGNKTVLTCAVDAGVGVTGRYLVPFGTVNVIAPTTKENAVNYFSWKVTPNLNDTQKVDPVTGKTLTIKYSDLTVNIKNKNGTVLASNKNIGGAIADASAMFTFGLTPAQFAGVAPVDVLAGIIANGTVLASSTDYYFAIMFKNTINAANVAYANCTIEISIDLAATSA